MGSCRCAPGPLFSRIDPFFFDLPTVYGFYVQCVSEDKRDVLPLIESSEPVPCEHAFHADDDVFFVGGDGSREVLWFCVRVLMD